MKWNTLQRASDSAFQVWLGGLGVVLLTLVCSRLRLDQATASLLYLIIVVLVSLRGNFVSAAIVALMAVLFLDYFFTPPPLLSQTVDVVAIAFLTVAWVTTRLISRMRQSFAEVEAAHEQLRLVIDTVPTLLAAVALTERVSADLAYRNGVAIVTMAEGGLMYEADPATSTASTG